VGALPTWWTSPLSSAWVAGNLFGISLLLRFLRLLLTLTERRIVTAAAT
jgi:hypothetical protein